MKYYIFLTSSIARVGGAQLYISRKCNYLIENGWNIIICYYTSGTVMIEYDKAIRFEQIYELSFLPTLFRTKYIHRILNRIIHYNPNDNIVIESHTVNLAYWGEILTSKTKARHIVYLLNENLTIKNKSTYSYLYYKYKNSSLFGITPLSLKQIFPSEQTEFPYLNAIGCTSRNIEDLPNNSMDHFKKKDWNILSIGRLEKDYIIPTFKTLANYANHHKNKSISLIIVGGSYHKQNRKKALSIFDKCKNVSIIDMGYIWPIPISCFINSDLTIASSGSAVIAESVGSPTIVIDGKDLKPIGIYKQTTDSFVLRKPEEKPIELSSLLDDILIHKKYTKNIHIEKSDILDYSSHMHALDNILPDNYPIRNLFNSNEGSLKKIVIFIIGPRVYMKVCNIILRLKKILVHKRK